MLKRIISLIVLLLVAAVCPAQNAQYLHGLIGRWSGGGGLEITGAIDRDVKLGETLAIGDIIEVTGRVFATSSPVRTDNPSTAPAGVCAVNGSCIAMSSDGEYLAVVHAGSPYLTTYRWIEEDNRYLIATQPDTLPSENGLAVALSADGQRLVVTFAGYPSLYSYSWIAANGRYEKTTDPDVAPDGNNWGVAISADGAFLAVSQYYANPALISYRWSGANNRYEKTTNPDTAQPTNCRDVAMSADGKRIAAVSDGEGLRSYSWIAANGRYEKTTDPDTAPGAYPVTLSMSSGGHFVAVGKVGTPALVGYTWDKENNRYAIASASDVSLAGDVWGTAMSADGFFVWVGHAGATGSATYLAQFEWNENANRYEIASEPDVAPSGVVKGVAVSSVGKFTAAAHEGTSAPAKLVTYRTDIAHTLKAYKSESGLMSYPVDLMYFGVMSEAGDEDDVKEAKMFFWKYDPLETMEP